ncbi:hypothetical protein PO903_04695 [Paenibacillus sp. PK4536]|uniref:hypothetical protein n=1 Tax=Paenibacillus sp. PK4536 TaxID=3024576 RepID=UPI0023592F6F|nr:hypothetical protein [Paenibacillus sp. PK4536]WIM40194.1 hypothetical protein PO903_04695 [Paenibacillus sp. PK4536]
MNNEQTYSIPDGYIPLSSSEIGEFYIAFEPHSHSFNIYVRAVEPSATPAIDQPESPVSMVLIGYLKVTYSQASKPTESDDDPHEITQGLDAVYISDFQIYFNYQDLKLAVPVITVLRDTLTTQGYRLLSAHLFKSERSYAKLRHTYIDRCGATIRREYSDYLIIEWRLNPEEHSERGT